MMRSIHEPDEASNSALSLFQGRKDVLSSLLKLTKARHGLQKRWRRVAPSGTAKALLKTSDRDKPYRVCSCLSRRQQVTLTRLRIGYQLQHEQDAGLEIKPNSQCFVILFFYIHSLLYESYIQGLSLVESINLITDSGLVCDMISDTSYFFFLIFWPGNTDKESPRGMSD